MMRNKDHQLTIYFFFFFKQSSTSSTVLYFVGRGIAEFLTNVIPLICQSFFRWMNEMVFRLNLLNSTVAKSVDIEMIRPWIFTSQVKDLIQIRLIILILKLLLVIMDVVLSSMNRKSQRLLLLTHFYNFIIYNILFHVFYYFFFL